MNSLRTQDILGAKPRVRHMPINLLRQRQVPTSFMTNMNPEFSQNFSSHQMMQQSRNQYSPVQFQNEDQNSMPFYTKNRLTKEPRYVNYDFTRKGQEPKYQNDKSSQSQLRRAASYNKNNEDLSKSSYQPPALLENLSASQQFRSSQDMNISVQYGKKSEEQASRRSQIGSRRSVDSRDFKQDEGKQIFRGLGYNIISNNKYLYLFECQKPK